VTLEGVDEPSTPCAVVAVLARAEVGACARAWRTAGHELGVELDPVDIADDTNHLRGRDHRPRTASLREMLQHAAACTMSTCPRRSAARDVEAPTDHARRGWKRASTSIETTRPDGPTCSPIHLRQSLRPSPRRSIASPRQTDPVIPGAPLRPHGQGRGVLLAANLIGLLMR
jgi:hypothetical protein